MKASCNHLQTKSARQPVQQAIAQNAAAIAVSSLYNTLCDATLHMAGHLYCTSHAGHRHKVSAASAWSMAAPLWQHGDLPRQGHLHVTYNITSALSTTAHADWLCALPVKRSYYASTKLDLVHCSAQAHQQGVGQLSVSSLPMQVHMRQTHGAHQA